MFLKIKQFILQKKVIVGLILLIALAVFLKAFVFNTKPVQVSAKVKRGDLFQELTLSGTIDADEKADLQFQTIGLLASVNVKEGDLVKKNQVIASLDQRQLQKTLQKTLNDYLTTRNSFDQTHYDNKDKIVDESIKRILDTSQNQLSDSVINVELQSLTIQLANLTSPISGLITRVDTPYPGVNITVPSQAIFEVINPDSLFLDVNADQTEVVGLKHGEEIKMNFDSYPNETIKGTIKSISFIPKNDQTGTVYSVKIESSQFANSNYKYKIGMTSDATFITAQRNNVLYLPINFVKSDDTGKYVISTGNKKIYVDTGLETDNDVEIKKGLSQGDIVYD